MKTTLAYALVLVFSGITSAQPVCFTICPTDAGPGDLDLQDRQIRSDKVL